MSVVFGDHGNSSFNNGLTFTPVCHAGGSPSMRGARFAIGLSFAWIVHCNAVQCLVLEFVHFIYGDYADLHIHHLGTVKSGNR
jgi:hypothetical protein